MTNKSGNHDVDQSEVFLDEIILAFAQSSPTKTAIVYRDQHVSYGELAQRVNNVCFALRHVGVEAGDFVVVLLPPAVDVTISLLAISRLGAIYAPLDPEHPDTQLRARCADITPTCIITDVAGKNRVQGWARSTVVVNEIAETTNKIDTTPVVRNLKAPACIFFTSGTTGEPKGVLGSFRAMRDSILSPVRFLDINENDTLNSIARYAWSISMLELLAPLVVGGTSLLLDRAQALNLDWLKANADRCTAFHCPPALLRKLADHIEENYPASEYPSQVRLVWYGGDTFSKYHIEKLHKVFPNATIGTAYGCTEIFGLSHCYFYPRGEAVEKVLVGKPVDSIKQNILNGEGKPVREGEEGQVYLAGPRIATEYWRQAELTAQKFVGIEGERHYATGDFGRLDAEGNLEFLQRRDSQVKIRGIRIELGEIEFYFHKLPDVKEAVVLAVGTEQGEKELRAYIVARQGADLNIDSLRRQLENSLPEYMVPTQIVLLDAFPVTENFKVDKKALVEYAPKLREGEFASATAKKIAAIWKQVTGKSPENSESNFFKSGGDSLSAAQLAALLGREFGRVVEVAEVYRAPVFKAQWQLLDSGLVTAAGQTTDNLDPVTTDIIATRAQKGLIFRELMGSKHASITCTRYIRARGFDIGVTKKALVGLIERYPTLKTHIRFDRREIKLVEDATVDESAIEVIRNPEIWTLEPGQKNSLTKASQKFDIKKDPLIKALISNMDDGSQIMQLTAHHIAADDNSMGRLAGDFVEIYDALLNQRQINLPPVQQDYREFACDQYTRIHEGLYHRQADAIGKRLLEYLPVCQNSPLLNLNNWTNHQAFSCNIAVPAEAAALHELKFTEYVAALSWAIHKRFGRDKMLFCAHVALRRDSDDAPRVGMFVNLLPLFTGVNPQHSPHEHVLRTQDDLDEAMSRSDIPYELILSEQRELKTLGRFPFDAFVNELRFDNIYPAGYEDVVVPRAFATDANEISMSLVRRPQGESIKLESPDVNGARDSVTFIGESMTDFIHSVLSNEMGSE